MSILSARPWCCGIQGQSRFNRLWNAAKSDAVGPPADLRFMRKEKSLLKGESATSKVTSYLETLYMSVAETLPDIKDDGIETVLTPDVAKEPPDAYVEALTAAGSSQIPASACTSSKPSNQKQRKRKFGLDLHVERQPANSGQPVKHLPPGCMRDYFDQFRALDEVDNCISFKTFWKCWKVEFPHLRFRPVSSHSQCNECVHHKLMLRELGHFLLAKKQQSDLYRAHLLAQYRDRQEYWQIRASSRLRATGQLVVILDGMDQCKFAYPRSPLTRAKQLSTMIRPKLHVVGALMHGFSMTLAISNHDHPKDSSVMTELLCHLLTRVSRQVRLQDHYVHVVSDNTTRETKNNTTLRLLSALTSHGLIMGGSLRNLRSGHSHEDIDQMFGNAALFVVRHAKQVETPDQFVAVMQKFCATAHRPFERERVVVKLDMHRDWILAMTWQFSFFCKWYMM